MTVMTSHSSTASPLTRAQDFCGSWKRGGPAELMSQLRRDAALTPPRRRRIDSAVETQYLYAEGGPPSQGAREPSVNPPIAISRRTRANATYAQTTV
ncbi:hypothetical protein CN138_30305 [Sinorhizobium meliloti]|nr:hypothetical protein CDO29_22255 [Sinorhizobium meliloti]ASP81240.1 hypothetical protein CDO27_25875 [Sinorhizobium meliloti]ATA95936.1 hypothetical protein BWO76_02375 [Sinorhizobium meliloti]ATB01030.1 hypothetical protein BWO90_02315 [Sinorhizobium meliloti]MQW17116.1 hypothetical protein [Sinorhizobium meliloti]